MNDFSIPKLERLLSQTEPEFVNQTIKLLKEVSKGLEHIPSVHALADNIQYDIDKETKLLLKISRTTEEAMLLLHHQYKNKNTAESSIFYGSLKQLKAYLQDPQTPQKIEGALKLLKQRLKEF